MIRVASLSLETWVQDVSHIVSAEHVDINEISFAEIIHSVLHEIVFGEALFKVNSFFVFEVKINHGINFELLFTETDGFSHSVG